ncbi:MAG: substrate-binding domain-containing protein [Terricaulis sp.]
MSKAARARVTMEDIAKLAGVAKITVSRALQDSPLVRAEVRDRVKAVARKQGYRLNTTARNLRLQRTHSITAVIETEPGGDRPIAEPLVQMVIGGMLNELAAARYQLVLTTRSMIEMSGAVDADGIVLLGQGANDEATRRIREFGLPIVVWGVPREQNGDAIFVCSDNFEGGRLVGRHLLERGRRNIVFLGDTSHSEVSERVRGLRNALGRKAKLSIVPCAFTQTAGRDAMRDAMARLGDVDGVAAASDMIALGAIAAVRENGKSVPEDVAVVGYDDTENGAGLTSVRQEWALAGATLASKVLQIVNNKKASSEQLPVQLIVRASTQV